MMLSPDHRMPLYDYEGKFVVKRAHEIESVPSRYTVPVNYEPTAPGIILHENLLRLAVAIHADGTIEYRDKNGLWFCRLSVRKQRKKDRLEWLLRENGIQWNEYVNPKRPTEKRYSFRSSIGTKHYAGEWWQASAHQLAVILDEMSYWDGNISGQLGGDICFNTTNKRDTDFMQYAAHACSRVATISTYKSESDNHKDLYKVHISHAGGAKSTITLRGDAVSIKRVQSEMMYCFTVPTSFWLARHEGKIFVTGNSAGGGKSDLVIGTAVTRHKKAIVFRKQYSDAKGLIDRAGEVLGDFGRWSGKDHSYKTNDRRELEFGHCARPGSEQHYQGRAHDYKGFDELPHFSEYEYLFLSGWLRSSDPKQRCRIVSAGNPPMTAEGRWIIRRWAPWLDKNHPNPAKSGELRWFASIDGKDTEVAGPEPFQHTDRAGKVETIIPRSRTFIPSRVQDNPYYRNSGYISVLQSMPEPLRSALLYGDFAASMEDDPWQVIPTAWVDAAMARWQPKPPGPMDTMGADPAMGGRDTMELAPRHGDWFGQLVSLPGVDVPTGTAAAALVVRHLRDGAVVQVDTIGIGAACYEHLQGMGVAVYAMDARNATDKTDRSGTLKFVNSRAQWWWEMREALDPEKGDNLSLPPSPELRADLTAPKWEPTVRGIKIESKEDIRERLQRSTGKGDAVIMALPQMILKNKDARKKNRPARANSKYNVHRLLR